MYNIFKLSTKRNGYNFHWIAARTTQILCGFSWPCDIICTFSERLFPKTEGRKHNLMCFVYLTVFKNYLTLTLMHLKVLSVLLSVFLAYLKVMIAKTTYILISAFSTKLFYLESKRKFSTSLVIPGSITLK